MNGIIFGCDKEDHAENSRHVRYRRADSSTNDKKGVILSEHAYLNELLYGLRIFVQVESPKSFNCHESTFRHFT